MFWTIFCRVMSKIGPLQLKARMRPPSRETIGAPTAHTSLFHSPTDRQKPCVRSRARHARCPCGCRSTRARGVSFWYRSSRSSRSLGCERGEVGAAHGGPSVRHARAHVHAHAEHLARALADLEEHHVQARRDRARPSDTVAVQVVGELLHERPRDVAHVERAEICVAEREHADGQRVAAGVGRVGEVAHLREREGEAAHRGLWEPRARGDLANCRARGPCARSSAGSPGRARVPSRTGGLRGPLRSSVERWRRGRVLAE